MPVVINIEMKQYEELWKKKIGDLENLLHSYKDNSRVPIE